MNKIVTLTTAMIFGLFVSLATTSYAETNTVTSTVTGTTTVDKTPPTASAPNVMINNQDVCSTGTSAAVQTQVFGMTCLIGLFKLVYVKMQESLTQWRWQEHLARTKGRLVLKPLKHGLRIQINVPITTNG